MGFLTVHTFVLLEVGSRESELMKPQVSSLSSPVPALQVLKKLE